MWVRVRMGVLMGMMIGGTSFGVATDGSSLERCRVCETPCGRYLHFVRRTACIGRTDVNHECTVIALREMDSQIPSVAYRRTGKDDEVRCQHGGSHRGGTCPRAATSVSVLRSIGAHDERGAQSCEMR